MRKQQKNLAWVTHLSCWLIIALLLVGTRREYIYRQAAEVLSISVEQSIGRALPEIEDSNYSLLGDIERVIEAYPTSGNQANLIKIYATQHLFDSIQQVVASDVSVDIAWKRLFLSMEPSREDQEKFNRVIWTDALRKEINRTLNRQNTSMSERKLLLRNLQLYNILNWQYLLDYIAQHNSQGCWAYTRFEPIIVSRQIYPVAGQPYKAELVLGSARNVHSSAGKRFWVNGHELPFQRNRFQYEQIFDRPGTYPLQVRVDVSGPGLGQVNTYQQDFELMVLAPDAGK